RATSHHSMSQLPSRPWSSARRATALPLQMPLLSDQLPASTRSTRYIPAGVLPLPVPHRPPDALRDPPALPTTRFVSGPASSRAPGTTQISIADRGALPLRARPALCKVFRRLRANANMAALRARESAPARDVRGNNLLLPDKLRNSQSDRCRRLPQRAGAESPVPVSKCFRPLFALPPEPKSRSRCLQRGTAAAICSRTP